MDECVAPAPEWLLLDHHDGSHTEPGLLLDNVVVSPRPIGCGH